MQGLGEELGQTEKDMYKRTTHASHIHEEHPIRSPSRAEPMCRKFGAHSAKQGFFGKIGV